MSRYCIIFALQWNGELNGLCTSNIGPKYPIIEYLKLWWTFKWSSKVSEDIIANLETKGQYSRAWLLFYCSFKEIGSFGIDPLWIIPNEFMYTDSTNIEERTLA